MEVILLEKIRNLGELGKRVKIRRGYARNYLVPQGKAVYATAANIARFEARRAELEKRQAEILQAAEARKQALLALGTLTLQVRAGEEGKLFGSVGTRDIADALAAAGVAVHRHEVMLPEGLLRQTGEYDIEVELHSDVTVILHVILASDTRS